MAVIVGFTPSPEGRAAVETARAEAQSRGTRLVIVNSQRGGASLDGAEARAIDAELEAIRASLDAGGVESEIRSLARGNDPTDDLIEIAEESNASLIVIGLRRRSAIGKLILGSNAQRILLEATCPVLAVKASRT